MEREEGCEVGAMVISGPSQPDQQQQKCDGEDNVKKKELETEEELEVDQQVSDNFDAIACQSPTDAWFSHQFDLKPSKVPLARVDNHPEFPGYRQKVLAASSRPKPETVSLADAPLGMAHYQVSTPRR